MVPTKRSPLLNLTLIFSPPIHQEGKQLTGRGKTLPLPAVFFPQAVVQMTC